MESINIGTRVAVANKRGTVQFCGYLNEVDGGKEEWLGIDWDNAEDGKHDGSYQGAQYFKARHPTSGSFVKASQVQFGRGFVETLREHYFDMYNNVNNENGVDFVLKKSAVSFENAFNMSAINLPNHRVSSLEPDANQQFRNCTLLDLSNNLLQDWTELFSILNLFPSLALLNISLNVMQPLESGSHQFQSQIKELVLNDCQLTPELLAALSSYFPALETLRIMKNGLETLPSLAGFTHLKQLYAGNNPFNDFTKLCHLATLEKLDTLSLPGCGFKSIKLSQPVGFNSLQVLNLNENPLNDWNSINEIGRLSCLKNFRSSGLHAGERGCQSYEILVAKLPHLTILDSCTISSSDRRECESFFLLHFNKKPLLDVHLGDLERLSKSHNVRLQSDQDEELQHNQEVSTNSCSFTLKYNDQTIERTLLLNLSIRKLVTLASRIFFFEPSSVKVLVQVIEDSYETVKWDASTVLRAFEPASGCTIHFVKKIAMSESKKRKILEFIIELVRLECRSITITYAAVYFHKVFDLLPSEFCLYTVACTCISLGAKAAEDQRIRIRHIVSVSYRILHPDDPPLPICDLEAGLRKSIASMEQVLLRFLKFDLKVDYPHNTAYMACASLRNWFPAEMATAPKFPTILGTILQDASIYPDFIVNNDHICVAVVIISLALQLSNVDLDDHRWVPLITKKTNVERLQKLKRRFLRVVYDESI